MNSPGTQLTFATFFFLPIAVCYGGRDKAVDPPGVCVCPYVCVTFELNDFRAVGLS